MEDYYEFLVSHRNRLIIEDWGREKFLYVIPFLFHLYSWKNQLYAHSCNRFQFSTSVDEKKKKSTNKKRRKCIIFTNTVNVQPIITIMFKIISITLENEILIIFYNIHTQSKHKTLVSYTEKQCIHNSNIQITMLSSGILSKNATRHLFLPSRRTMMNSNLNANIFYPWHSFRTKKNNRDYPSLTRSIFIRHFFFFARWILPVKCCRIRNGFSGSSLDVFLYMG